MMDDVILFAGFGLIGGGVRVLVSFLKRDEGRVDLKVFLIYLVTLLLVGSFCGIVLGYSKTLSFLAGYAGIDLIDGFYKTFMKKKVKMPKKKK